MSKYFKKYKKQIISSSLILIILISSFFIVNLLKEVQIKNNSTNDTMTDSFFDVLSDIILNDKLNSTEFENDTISDIIPDTIPDPIPDPVIDTSEPIEEPEEEEPIIDNPEYAYLPIYSVSNSPYLDTYYVVYFTSTTTDDMKDQMAYMGFIYRYTYISTNAYVYRFQPSLVDEVLAIDFVSDVKLYKEAPEVTPVSSTVTNNFDNTIDVTIQLFDADRRDYLSNELLDSYGFQMSTGTGTTAIITGITGNEAQIITMNNDEISYCEKKSTMVLWQKPFNIDDIIKKINIFIN
jgi:hypothetical protein